jgi:excisionase family DNA binding protein
MELLTVEDTAQMLKVSTVTVRRFIAAGKLPAVRVGKGIRIEKQAIELLAEPFQGETSRGQRAEVSPRPMTFDDPLFQLIGSATDAPPTDSSKKYEIGTALTSDRNFAQYGFHMLGSEPDR